VYSKGIKYRGEYGMLIASHSTASSRFGFVLNKKIGNAVQRHRMTRLLRVIVLELVDELSLDQYKYSFEYVAFKFCNSKEDLKIELLNQFKTTIK
jgi:ribonuclease P protein component